MDNFIRNEVNPNDNLWILTPDGTYHLKGYQPDGKFRSIEVRVPAKDFRVIHRLGYFAE